MNILLTSAGRRTYLVKYFKEALGKNGKIIASNSSFTPTLLSADEYFISPLIYEDNYIDFLLDECKKRNIDAVISLFDIDLSVLALNKEKFVNNNIELLISDYGFIQICEDKYKTYEFLKDNNLPVIPSYINKGKLINDINNGIISYPIILKPRFGMGSIGLFIADNLDELNVLYKKCENAINSSYLKYESKAFENESVLMQPFLKSEEYGLDIINDINANYVNTICKRKLAMRAGETDIAETVFDESLKKLGQRISKLSKHICNLDCDVLKYNDKYYILEMNPRFGGGYPFSHAANINLPKAIISWLNNEDGTKYLLNEKIGKKSYKELTIFSE